MRLFDDLIKRDDVLFMIDAFERDFEQSWRAQFRANINAIPAVKDDRIEQLEGERDYTEGTNDVLIAENQRLEAKLAKAVGALRQKLAKAAGALRPFADVLKGNYSHQPDTMPISMGFGEYDRRLALKLMDFRNARAVLAELETEPLGAEFEAVWDANKEGLYEP